MSKDRNNACPVKKTSIGGQALMEGIMMRGPKTTAMAVRNPQGEIVIETFPTVGKPRPAICRWPIIRGVVGFVDSMSFGYKCLMRSAEIAGLEEMEAELEREKAEKKAAKKAEKEAKKAKKQGISEAVSAPAETVEPAQADETAEPAQAAEIVEPAQAEAAAEPADGKAKKKGSVMMDVLTVVMMILSFALVIGLFNYLLNKNKNTRRLTGLHETTEFDRVVLPDQKKEADGLKPAEADEKTENEPKSE